MKFPKLPWLSWATDVLARLSIILIFAPWVFLVSSLVEEEGVLAFLACLIALALLASLIASWISKLLDKLVLIKRYAVTVLFSLVSLLLPLAATFLPGLSGIYLPFPWPYRMLLGLVFWVLGVRLGSQPSSNYSMQRHLIWGTMGAAIYLITAHVTGIWDEVLPQLTTLMILWFAAAIAATSLLRIKEYSGGFEQGEGNSMSIWSPLFFIGAPLLVLLAAVTAFFIPGLTRILQVPFFFLLNLIRLLLQLFGFILGYAMYLFYRIFSRFFEHEEVTFQDLDLHLPEEVPEITPALEAIPLIFEFLMFIGTIAGVIIFLATIMYLIIIASRDEKVEITEETRESYASISALKNWGSDWLDGLRGTLDRRLTGLRLRRFLNNPKTAVEIYNALLISLALKGTKKPPHITPQNFQPHIHEHLPKFRRQTDGILNAFLQEFYGQEKTKPPALKHLQEDWQTLKKEIFQRRRT